MGTTLNPVDALGTPFRSVDEQVFVTPTDGCNEVDNRNFKVNFLLQGECLHEIDGVAPVRFVAGDIVVIPRRCRHRYWSLKPGQPARLHALRLVFDPDILPALTEAPPPASDTDYVAFLRHHLREPCHLPGGQDALVRPLLAAVRQEAEQRPLGYRFRVTALLAEVMVHVVRQLTRNTADEPTTRRHGRDQLVLQAKEFLLKNLASDLDLLAVARHLHVSPEHLARCFKQETGETVFGHLRRQRLERAKTYLLGSDRSIAEVAALTGFSSVSLFSRNFKRRMGASPLAYRQERWSGGTPSKGVREVDV